MFIIIILFLVLIISLLIFGIVKLYTKSKSYGNEYTVNLKPSEQNLYELTMNSGGKKKLPDKPQGPPPPRAKKMDYPPEVSSCPNLKNKLDEMSSRGCNRAVVKQSWKGEAPFCEGAESDCSRLQPYGDWVYCKSDDSGDGSSCWSGEKVLCNRAVCVDKDLEYADNINSWWVGTAPFCSADECDCISQYGAVPWKTNDSGDDGSSCWTGKKQLCLRPVDTNADFAKWTDEAKTQCNADKKVSQEHISKGLDIISKLVDKAVESA
jgi:hypothetical protein